jgi:hypothetical protein
MFLSDCNTEDSSDAGDQEDLYPMECEYSLKKSRKQFSLLDFQVKSLPGKGSYGSVIEA